MTSSVILKELFFIKENRSKLSLDSLEMMQSTTIRTRQFHHFLTILVFERIKSEILVLYLLVAFQQAFNQTLVIEENVFI